MRNVCADTDRKTKRNTLLLSSISLLELLGSVSHASEFASVVSELRLAEDDVAITALNKK